MDEHEEDIIVGAEAIVGVRIRPLIAADSGAMLAPREEFSMYVMFHWPWSLPGDVDSHSLISFN